MKCNFCEADMAYYLFTKCELDYCKDCRISSYSRDGKLIRRTFHVSKSETEYEICLDWENTQTKIYLAGCDEPTFVTSIPHIMDNITPQNINDKLKTLLTFL
jgi:hypothetical protein